MFHLHTVVNMIGCHYFTAVYKVSDGCYKDYLPIFDTLFNGMPYVTSFGYCETDECYQLHVIVPQHSSPERIHWRLCQAVYEIDNLVDISEQQVPRRVWKPARLFLSLLYQYSMETVAFSTFAPHGERPRSRGVAGMHAGLPTILDDPGG